MGTIFGEAGVGLSGRGFDSPLLHQKQTGHLTVYKCRVERA